MKSRSFPPVLGDVLRRGAARLEAGGASSARLDAELLLARVLGRDRAFLHRERDGVIDSGSLENYRRLIDRRRTGEPVAYILGEKEFWSLDFFVSPAVLIPRPETELLVEECLRRFSGVSRDPLSFLDVGTGSGILAVVLAGLFPASKVAASDISRDALRVAAENARRHGVADRVTFFLGDMLHPVRGPFDGIVSNPPYVDAAVFDDLERDVRDFEPARALLAGEGGTACHRALIEGGPRRLKPGGWLLMEIGDGQGGRVRDLFERSGGYEDVSVSRDYGGRERVAAARRKR